MEKPLEQAVSTFDRVAARELVLRAEETRREIIAQFPASGWVDLPLERYALGQAEGADTYGRLLEFKSPSLGSISGGSSHKHIIYKHKKKPGWYFPQQFSNVEEAWHQLRSDFATLVDPAHRGKWEEFVNLLPFQYGPALTLKTLHLYFPDEILNVYSLDHLAHFRYRLKGVDPKVSKKLGQLRLNRLLLEELRDTPSIGDWDTAHLGRLLYHWDDPRQAHRIYKIAPGELGKFWDESLAKSYIPVGWDATGDLRDYEDFEQFSEQFRAKYESQYGTTPAGRAKTTQKAKEVWRLSQIEPGDIIVANRGISELLGVGEVQDPAYEWDETRPDYRHTVRVKWTDTASRQIPPQKRWAFLTIAPVSLADYEQLIAGETRPQTQVGGTTPKAIADPLYVELGELLDERKQLVLYGPPGTGKTHNARRFLLHWLLAQAGEESGFVLADANRARQKWASFTQPSKGDVAQVTMLTFHPSYSYEDFVEGFRPVPTADSGLKLALEDGVFKRVCSAAATAPDRPYVLFIDEINRANLPKVFGELITIIEADKRGLRVTLPQSKDLFSIPSNVFIVGTMNTADRSIKVLDAAFRRRFAFHEVMPQPDLLAGVQFGDLAVDDFLEHLNVKISKKEGREKQLGHAVFFIGDEPVSEVEEFARRIRYEVIPLLQEYCYEDYGALVDYLGPEIVIEEGQRLNTDLLQDPQALVAALARMLAKESSDA